MANTFQSTVNTGLQLLKNFYQGPVKDQFNEDLPVYRAAEKQKKGWSGQQVVRPLRVRRNQGIGAASDGGALPKISKQTPIQATIGAKYNYLRFGITGPMIKASASDVGSFVRDAAYELEMGYKDLKSDVNRQLGWDGTGTLAKANANTTASTSLVIKGRETNDAALRFVDVDLTFDIVSGGVVTNSGITVNAVSQSSLDATTATLTLDTPVTCSAGDLLIRTGTLNQEIQGLLYALDAGTSTIYGVNRATYPSYQGSVYDKSGAQMTLDSMQQVYNAGLRRGGAKYDGIISDFDSLRFYQKLLTADKRYVNTTKGDAGFGNKDQTYLEFNGIPWTPDKDFPQRVMMLDKSNITNYVLCELEFADETGSMMIAQTGVDAFEVRIRLFCNLFNEMPSACGVMTNYISP